MHARVLGPFEVEDGGRRVSPGGARQKAVLARLVLSPNEVVPSEQLLMELWGEDAPATAANALQAVVSRLRKLLPAGRLDTVPPGYRLAVLPGERDLDEFERLFADGRSLRREGSFAEATRTLHDALALWRGPALADFRYEPFAQAETARLEELRLACTEERLEAELSTGAGGALVPELQQLVTEQPQREHLRGQLMRALYQDGRQGDALEVFRDLRTVLDVELGLDPSPPLTQLYRAILRHDPELAAAPVPSPARPRLLRRFVTVVCADLRVGPATSGSGLLASSALDPEALAAVHDRAQAAFAPVVTSNGGNVVHSTPARLVGVFGVMSFHEDDAVRAGRAALEGREALEALSALLGREYGIGVEGSWGIASTEALVGTADDMGFSGDAAAQAIDLAEAAAGGQVLIADQTRRLAADALAVKAFDSGQAYQLQSVLAGARPIAVRLDAPLAGRDDEARRIGAAIARGTRRRATVLVTVVGDAGLGKTRLVHDLVGRLGPHTITVSGRCLPYGNGITYWPLREMVTQAAAGTASPESLRALLAGEPDADVVVTRLMSALGAQTGAPSDTAEIFWAARRLFDTLAGRQPLVVVFEDLHWAEPTLLDLVEGLTIQPGGRSMVVFAIARPELFDQRPSWGARVPDAVRVDLAPLDDEDSMALLETLVGPGVAEPIRRRVCEVAAGNPLYLEQLALSIGQQELDLSGSTGEVLPAIPATIAALLAARLERLGPAERDVLACAAVMGKDFWQAAVRELLPPQAHHQVERHLQSLTAKGMVQHRSGAGAAGEDYTFRHILIQQATYRAMPKAQRAQLHEQFFDWLDERASRLSDPHEVLGYHLEQAVRYRTELLAPSVAIRVLALRAADHLESAGMLAHARGDDLAAVKLLERTGALVVRGDPRRAQVLTKLGAALTDAGAFDRAAEVLDEARWIAEQDGDSGLAAHVRVQDLMRHLQVDPDQAIRRIESESAGLETTFTRGDDQLGLCLVRSLEAAGHWNQARSARAQESWGRAADHARRAGARRHLANSFSWLASAALWGPTHARKGIEECEGYLTETGDLPPGRAMIMVHLAGLYAMQDDFRRADELLRGGQEIAVDFGSTVTAVVAAEPAALIAMLAADPAAAEGLLREGMTTLDRMGDRAHLATTAAKVAQAIGAGAAERHQEVEELVLRSREAGADLDVTPRIIGDGALARSLAARGEQERAEVLAVSAVDLAATTDLISQHGDACLDLAWVLLRGGNAARSMNAAASARTLFEQKGNLPGIRRADNYLAAAREGHDNSYHA
jgi:DNA-binding SARP family transcriptional activator